MIKAHNFDFTKLQKIQQTGNKSFSDGQVMLERGHLVIMKQNVDIELMSWDFYREEGG